MQLINQPKKWISQHPKKPLLIRHVPGDSNALRKIDYDRATLITYTVPLATNTVHVGDHFRIQSKMIMIEH